MSAVQLLIFTDLDGSLLDHHTYSYAPAQALLTQLDAYGVPVIPTTSKTRAELELLRQQLRNAHPFVVENGAAVFCPEFYFEQLPEDVISYAGYSVKQFVANRVYWQTQLAQLDPDLQQAFISFGQADLSDIQNMTGLPEQSAQLAAQREFGEPLKWLGDEANLKRLVAKLHEMGASVLQGGRFVHVSGDCDKGKALRWLEQIFYRQYPDRELVTIALGDSQNDIAMLEAADHAVMIKSPVHDYPIYKTNKVQDVYATEQYGPQGWAEGISRILQLRNIALS